MKEVLNICAECGEVVFEDEMEDGACPYCGCGEFLNGHECDICGEAYAGGDLTWIIAEDDEDYYFCEKCTAEVTENLHKLLREKFHPQEIELLREVGEIA